MAYFDPNSASYLTNKQWFANFLDRDNDEASYANKIRDMLTRQSTRLVVNIDDLRRYDGEKTAHLIIHPIEYIAPMQAALGEYIRAMNNTYGFIVSADTKFFVGFEGSFGSQRVSPRQLEAKHLGQLVCVEGIATKCSAVRPKIVQTVHYCNETGAYSRVTFHDHTSMTGFATGSAYPTKDDKGNPLVTEFGLSEYQDNQTLAIQEMPERAPAGLLPCSVDVVLDRDLCDGCKPGDRVQVVGVFRPLPSNANGETAGLFRTLLIANLVRPLTRSAQTASAVTEEDIRHIRTISKRPDLFNLLSASVAPSIYGHENIKKAVLLLLLGGVEKNLDNGTHIRGDINVLMVGDPSTAKSQILRYVLNIAPLAINTTGRGSSGVGLTAAVTTDNDTGERRLEAGAMVLADRGIVCIDEFDKMSDMDRVAIHEVMEQQTVTIAKAGIQMSLNARCSVLAAANPVYGKYDTSLKPHVNVGLQDSLLSRFDLLFIVLDTPDPALDREIAQRVLNNHRFQAKNGSSTDGDKSRDGEPQEEKGPVETSVFQKYDRNLHAGLRGANGRLAQGGKIDLLSIDFLKKYIEFAKTRYEPILSEEASAFISEKYAQLRKRAEGSPMERSLPITARALETMIRLACAHCKARLSATVTERDCEVAFELMQFSLEAATKAEELADGKGPDGDDDDDDADEDDDAGGAERKSSSSSSPARRGRAAASSAASPGQKRGGKSPSRKSKKRRNDSDDDESDSDNDRKAKDDDSDDDDDAAPASTTAPVSNSARRQSSRPAPTSTTSSSSSSSLSSSSSSSPISVKSKRKGGDSAPSDADNDDGAMSSSSPARRRATTSTSTSTPTTSTTATTSTSTSPARRRRAMEDEDDESSQSQSTQIDPARLSLFRKMLARYMRARGVTECNARAALTKINELVAGTSDKAFTFAEMEKMLIALSDANKIMYREEVIHLIAS